MFLCEAEGQLIMFLSCSHNGRARALGLSLVRETPKNQTENAMATPNNPATSYRRNNIVYAIHAELQGRLEWRTIYILARPQYRSNPMPLKLHTLSGLWDPLVHWPPPPFRFSLVLLRTIDPNPDMACFFHVHGLPFDSSDNPAILFFCISGQSSYRYMRSLSVLSVTLGRCRLKCGNAPEATGSHYARILSHWSSVYMDDPALHAPHSCAEDHITSEEMAVASLVRTVDASYILSEHTVRVVLRFAVCPVNPKYTLVLKHLGITSHS